MSIQIKSFNQVLGGMVRKIVAETPLSDVNPGSVLLSLLEACASSDFENNVAILNVLELLSVDSLKNSDLDSRASDLGLTRRLATAASGFVSFYNTNIEKQSASLYSLKAAPIAGQTSLYVDSTDGWSPTGSLYIGRGTPLFEGPISYTSITTFGTYSQIKLGTALQKDHLLSDTVINAQGQPNRVIPAGTTVKIPANNQNPEIQYSTVREAIIPAGESQVDNVLVVASTLGTIGNALIGTIKQFDAIPFTGAAVSNTTSFTNGLDVEKDEELRNRLKSYTSSLARGTTPAILSAVLGLFDPDDNKRVTSANLVAPVIPGDPAILYVDDGNGFQPSFSGQAVDTLLTSAKGGEEFLQLSNYPLTRPQITCPLEGPFSLIAGSTLKVAVDGSEDSVQFEQSDFRNITVATLAEIVAAINSKATLFKARLTNSSKNILLYPVSADCETLQVLPLLSSEDEKYHVNFILRFPTREVSYISLYKNGVRLKQQAKTATVESVPFAAWNLLFDGTLTISVDGTPAQTGAFTIADFTGIASYNLLTLENWVDAINAKFAGVTATATPGQTLLISSNKTGNKASIEIISGTYRSQMFGSNETFSVGQESQFEINRQTGNIRLTNKATSGDIISAGITDAKGFIQSQVVSGVLDLSIDEVGRVAEAIFAVDSTFCEKIPLSLENGQLLRFSEGGDKTRILAFSNSVFKQVQPGHFIYIAARNNWVSDRNTGLFKVIARGPHLTPGEDTYIDIANKSIGTLEETVTVTNANDIVVFDTDVYPQLWSASMVFNPPSISLVDLASSISETIRGIKVTLVRTEKLRITSFTEENGSISVPVVTGNLTKLFSPTNQSQTNHSPLIANKVSQDELCSFPKIGAVASENTYLGRSMYGVVHSALTASSTGKDISLATPIDVTDLSNNIVFTRGDNKKLISPIADATSSTALTIQNDSVLLDHLPGDELTMTQSLRLVDGDSVVCVLDNDPSARTINVDLTKTGKVNAGSSSSSFVPTSTEFSADDVDNEAGIDFGTTSVWGTSVNNTSFDDYTLLMRARNWYASEGVNGTQGKLIIRSAEFGVNGNNLRFSVAYPSSSAQTGTTQLVNAPSYSKVTYILGSGSARATTIPVDTTVTITGPYDSTSVNFPAGAATTGNYYDLTFPSGILDSVLVGDVISIQSGSGFTNFIGQFGIKAKSSTTIRVLNAAGSSGTQTISIPALISFFPLADTTVTSVINSLNESGILVAAAIGSPANEIRISTGEEINVVAQSHSVGTDYIQLFDGVNWVKSFQNTNPNFTLKKPFDLMANAIYSLNTAQNDDGTSGEYFRLAPSTADNLRHHFTQKALSQLPILSSVTLADKGKKVQLSSKKLGSAGAVQILGGSGNQSKVAILGESQAVQDGAGKYLLVNTPAFPSTWMTGDIVKLENPGGVKRRTILDSTDKISVVATTEIDSEYRLEPKVTNFTSTTTFTIIDVSSSYTDQFGTALQAGVVWRWTHSAANAETLSSVKVGDVIVANIPTWDQGNLGKSSGDGAFAGLPIIAVTDSSHSIDVICPFGKAMASTAIGTGSVSIFPSPVLRWNFAHSVYTKTDSISRNNNDFTVICSEEHNLNTGDMISVRDSDIIVDGVYGPITVSSSTTFVFTYDSGLTEEPTAQETASGATVISTTQTATKYRLETLDFNGMTRLICVSGNSPRFADCGVAVDDYLVLSGETFGSVNNGTFRVIAVENDSIVFQNPKAQEVLNTVTAFNNKDLTVLWTVGSTSVVGSTGAFKNLSAGVWVKKPEDENSKYIQVIGCNTGDFATATRITLGSPYTGLTGFSGGVGYNQTNDVNAGVLLQKLGDLVVLEGDSAFVGDTLSVQNVTDSNWFNSNNSGTFEISALGTDPGSSKPFIRVKNSVAEDESNREMSSAPEGFYIVENDRYKFSTYRKIVHSSLTDFNSAERVVYLVPNSRIYKISETNATQLIHTGKLNYDLDVSTGIDGYCFYTGLLRRVQRTIDGYGPDPINFPERRAIGGKIETMPPLIKKISLVLTIATKGSVVQDIVDNIKSAIIDYVNRLGVGEDVILSAITSRIMTVKGVDAVTFNVPSPTEERIVIGVNEKAVIAADDIGIA